MPRAASRLSLIMVAAICLQPLGLAQNASPADETALRAVAEKLFASYASEDLEGFMGLWSANSPELLSRRKSMQEVFAANERIGVKSLTVGKVKVEKDKASLRATVEMSAAVAKTGKPAEDFGRMNRALDFVKEEGQWKVWREAAAEQDLAAALVQAKTDEERDALLAVDKELITAELWKALIRLGKGHYGQSNYQQALTIDQLAHSIAEQIGDKVGIAQALNDIAAVQYSQGNYGLALEYFQRSLMLRKALGDRVNIANSLNNLGTVYSSQGNHRLAAEHYQKALVEFESLGHKLGIATVLHNMGNTYYFQGNYDLAMENYEKALKHFEAVGHKAGVGVTLNNIGNIHSKQGDYGLSLDYYQKSLRVKEALDNKAGIAASLQNIGKNHELQGRYDRALEYFQKSLAQYDAIGERGEGQAVVLGEIGLLYYSQGDYAKALEFSERAASMASQIDGREVLWEVRTTAGRAYRALNQPVQARRAFEDAIATIEEMRSQVAGGALEQQRSFENKISPYHAMVELLVVQNEPAEALAYAERARARVLLDVLQSGRSNITKAMTAPESEKERRLRSELVAFNAQVSREALRPQPDQTRVADLKARLQKARLEYEAFETSLYAAHPELRVQRGEAKTVTLEETAELLPGAESALLEYVVTDEKIYLFVLSKGYGNKQRAVNLKAYTLPIKRKELADLANAFRQQLARRDSNFRQAAIGLHDVLVKPALAELKGKQTLVIVPDGALWELPFQALQDASGRYLIEDHALFYAPSLNVLREMSTLRKRKAAAKSTTLLAMGNPELEKETAERVRLVHRDERLNPLPEAEREVKTLAQLYGVAQSKVYIGAEAREDRLKSEAGRFSVLHLATHAILNDASPMYSQVLLARARRDASEDGLLEAWEIMKLDLKADLVVLSACETGRGRVGVGEGMIGLTWALFVAGSPTAVVSQWKVESASTTALMLEFHRNLRAGIKGSRPRVSTAKALQRAAVKMLRSEYYRHPFYWAGFVVVGDGG